MTDFEIGRTSSTHGSWLAQGLEMLCIHAGTREAFRLANADIEKIQVCINKEEL